MLRCSDLPSTNGEGCDYYACMPFPMNSGLCYGDTVDQHFERVAVEIEANVENPPQLLQKFRSMYPE